MSKPVNNVSTDQSLYSQKSCLPPTIVKVGCVVLALLLLGGAVAGYFLHINAIAVYATGAVGGALLVGTILTSLILHCASHKQKPRSKPLTPQAGTITSNPVASKNLFMQTMRETYVELLNAEGTLHHPNWPFQRLITPEQANLAKQWIGNKIKAFNRRLIQHNLREIGSDSFFAEFKDIEDSIASWKKLQTIANKASLTQADAQVFNACKVQLTTNQDQWKESYPVIYKYTQALLQTIEPLVANIAPQQAPASVQSIISAINPNEPQALKKFTSAMTKIYQQLLNGEMKLQDPQWPLEGQTFLVKHAKLAKAWVIQQISAFNDKLTQLNSRLISIDDFFAAFKEIETTIETWQTLTQLNQKQNLVDADRFVFWKCQSQFTHSKCKPQYPLISNAVSGLILELAPKIDAIQKSNAPSLTLTNLQQKRRNITYIPPQLQFNAELTLAPTNFAMIEQIEKTLALDTADLRTFLHQIQNAFQTLLQADLTHPYEVELAKEWVTAKVEVFNAGSAEKGTRPISIEQILSHFKKAQEIINIWNTLLTVAEKESVTEEDIPILYACSQNLPEASSGCYQQYPVIYKQIRTLVRVIAAKIDIQPERMHELFQPVPIPHHFPAIAQVETNFKPEIKNDPRATTNAFALQVCAAYQTLLQAKLTHPHEAKLAKEWVQEKVKEFNEKLQEQRIRLISIESIFSSFKDVEEMLNVWTTLLALAEKGVLCAEDISTLDACSKTLPEASNPCYEKFPIIYQKIQNLVRLLSTKTALTPEIYVRFQEKLLFNKNSQQQFTATVHFNQKLDLNIQLAPRQKIIEPFKQMFVGTLVQDILSLFQTTEEEARFDLKTVEQILQYLKDELELFNDAMKYISPEDVINPNEIFKHFLADIIPLLESWKMMQELSKPNVIDKKIELLVNIAKTLPEKESEAWSRYPRIKDEMGKTLMTLGFVYFSDYQFEEVRTAGNADKYDIDQTRKADITEAFLLMANKLGCDAPQLPEVVMDTSQDAALAQLLQNEVV